MSESPITLGAEERKKLIQDARANLERVNAGSTSARQQGADIERREVELAETVGRHRPEEEEDDGDLPQPEAP